MMVTQVGCDMATSVGPIWRSPARNPRPSTVDCTVCTEVNTLQLPSCVRCGAPLPAVPADPQHPELCPACAVRALDAPGAAPVSPAAMMARGGQPPWVTPGTLAGAPAPAFVIRTRWFDGILVGLAAAGLGGAAWWALSTATEVEFWPFLSAIVGLIVALGVMLGTRTRGPAAALLAVVFSALAVGVAVYFIDRSLTISSYEAAKQFSDIPLWDSLGAAKDVYKNWYDFDRTKALGWLLGPAVALVTVVLAGSARRAVTR